MQTVTNKFSWGRFWEYSRAVVLSERRSVLLKAFGFLGFCVIIYLIFNIGTIFGGKHYIANETRYVMPRMFVIVAGSFLVFFNISSSFKRFFSRGKASAAFMLPVSRTEKFMHAFLGNVILVPLFLTLGVLLNDALWSGLIGIKPMWSELDWFISEIGRNMKEDHGWFVASLMIGQFSSLLFYFLGSVFFRRHQFIFTVIANIIISIPFILLMNIMIVRQLANRVDPFMMNQWMLDWSIPSFIFSVVFSVVLFYLAWRRFATLQITK